MQHIGLVQWDIDKTLVDSGGVGESLFAVAFEEVTGRAPDHLPEMAGEGADDTEFVVRRRGFELLNGNKIRTS